MRIGKTIIIMVGLLFIAGCATPTSTSPIINIYKTVQNGNFAGDCMKDDKGRVSCPKIKQSGAITSNYTTSSDIKPEVSATQETTASPNFDLKVSPAP